VIELKIKRVKITNEKIIDSLDVSFLDKNGEVYAIFTADVALDWLTDMINSIKSYPGSYSFIVGKTGTALNG
jgi:sigma-B regulation protein RsbU (phosphoserine phosphatase)